MRAIFANRFIQSIMLSGLFLQTGIWVRNFAILLFVTEQTDKDPVAISLISVAEFAPIFLFSFIGGAFADRWRPKLTMVVCDLLSAASVFAVLLALIYGGWEAIFFATLVSSILSQFSQPAGMKLFKIHVPEAQMQMGMSMYQTVMAMFMVIGPMLGTLVYFKFGIDTAIAIMGTCFLLSAAVLTLLPADQKVEGKKPESKLGQEMKMGFHYVWSNKIFVYMGFFFLAAGLGLGLVNPLGIFLVTENLGLTSESLQWFTVVNGVGMVIGGMAAMGFAKKMTPQVMLMTGFVCSAISVAILGNITMVGWALAVQFVAGFMGPLIHIACNTLILNHAEESFVGRVNGILNPLFMGGMVINMSVVGLLKAQLPLGTLYLMASGLFLIGAVGMLPMLRIKAAKQVKVAHSMHH
ncbi:MFS transporter [Cohnella pontilimi]|uniref:MFS transporter n=1 Tax=Cohnella pontilimi TaxID=2564100 RepID=A0A4V5LS98_9BACL|nr:MFS transporter [Cohnella pontilimi]TJY42209.1 MFS transporter [Cohnella pontilimi]